MVDISTTNIQNPSILKSLKKFKPKGITVYSSPDYYEIKGTDAYTLPCLEASSKFNFSSEKGMHYSIDQNTIGFHIPIDLKTDHLRDGKNTYINSALYQNKANDESIGIAILMPQNHDYSLIERKAIKFIALTLHSNNWTIDCLMRGFDLNKSPSPLHMLEKEKWELFVNEVGEILNFYNNKKDADIDKTLEKYNPILTNSDARKVIMDNLSSASDYVKKFEPDDRGIKAIKENSNISVSEIKKFSSKNKSNYSYSVNENPPGSSEHCSRAFDTLIAKVTPDPLNVEPIYPDIIVPPGGSSVLVDSVESNKEDAISSNVSLSGSDFEKRQKSFNIKDYKGIKKDVKGKPVNNNDAYPVDTKIKELESHSPKLKIDEVDFKLDDCNHPGSIIGKSVSKNFAMIQDELITLSKRTESRISKIENILSTVARNLFRCSSRMHVNCVYYGGQDIYGKYKTIRCTHDDRIHDGQSMTLDQCLSCTRYEPIIGQVYAILEDGKDNVAQVLDDMQMAFMDIDEYAQLSRNENIITERHDADLSLKSKEPKPFKEIWDKGFSMDWNQTSFDNQRPKVADYKTEGIEAKKQIITKENEPSLPQEFKDIVSDSEPTEVIKYSTEDYDFEDFGDSAEFSSLGADGSFGMGASEVRKKIVEYVKNALKLCQDGKAGYSQANRQSHLDKAINGISYWDCSSLASAAYMNAGINSIQGNTVTEYPKCLAREGGILIPANDSAKALPGDLVWFLSGTHPTSSDEMQKVDPNAIPHVAIYIGNGQYIQAATDSKPLREQISQKPTSGWDKRLFGFGRPRELVEADKQASLTSMAGSIDLAKQQFPTWVINIANKYVKSQVDATVKSVKKYGYGPGLVKIAKAHGLDPYIVLGLIATESSGDPTCREAYWGIMQTLPSKTKATTNLDDILHDIGVGCDELIQKKNAIKSLVPQLKDNIGVILYAYNAGEGTVQRASKKISGQLKPDMPLGLLSEPITQVAIATWGQYKHDEVAPYAPRVLIRAEELRKLKVLE